MAREQYEVHWKDYYEVLQVHARAEQTVITVTYRKLAQLYHPDHNKSPDATTRFRVINEAYEVLSDPTRRNRYDEVYRLKQNGVTSQRRAQQKDTPKRAYHQEAPMNRHWVRRKPRPMRVHNKEKSTLTHPTKRPMAPLKASSPTWRIPCLPMPTNPNASYPGSPGHGRDSS